MHDFTLIWTTDATANETDNYHYHMLHVTSFEGRLIRSMRLIWRFCLIFAFGIIKRNFLLLLTSVCHKGKEQHHLHIVISWNNVYLLTSFL